MRAIITDLTKLNKAIDSIASRGKKLDSDIQVAGLSALAHVEKCGDIGPVNRLYLALARGARKNALTEWLLAFGKVVANEGEDKKDKPFLHSKDKVTQLEMADAKPWYEFKPEPAPDQVFDLQAAVAALIRRASAKALSDGGPELLEKLRSVAAEVAPAVVGGDVGGDDAGDPLNNVGEE